MDKFEEKIHSDLQQYLLSVNEIDERLPECPDVGPRAGWPPHLFPRAVTRMSYALPTD